MNEQPTDYGISYLMRIHRRLVEGTAHEVSRKLGDEWHHWYCDGEDIIWYLLPAYARLWISRG